MYLFDAHVHTDESSICAKVAAKDLVKLYKQAGYSGICVTDHFQHCNQYNYYRTPCQPWEKAVEMFMQGFRKAEIYGLEYDLVVLLGAEIYFRYSPHEYLLYGLTEKFLYEYPNLPEYDLPSFYKIAREHGILIFIAHPFRGEPKEFTSDDLKYVDGIEAVNGHNLHWSSVANELAAKLARENHLLISAGSDCHYLEGIGRNGIMTNERIENMDMLKNCLTKSDINIYSSTGEQ